MSNIVVLQSGVTDISWCRWAVMYVHGEDEGLPAPVDGVPEVEMWMGLWNRRDVIALYRPIAREG